MAHDDATKLEARNLFVHKRLALTNIAALTGVSLPTINRWKREAKEDGDDWDKVRANALVTGDGYAVLIAASLEEFALQFQSTMEALKDDRDLSASERVKLMATLSDAFNKTVAAASRSAPKLSELGVAYDVLKRLAEFVSRKNPEQADVILEILGPFGDYLAEVYDGR